MLTIHYHRFDGNYEDIALWTWDKKGERNPELRDLDPAGWDDYGPFFRLNPGDYGTDPFFQSIGFIIRRHRDWNAKDGGDRFWTPQMGRQIWLIGDDGEIYRDRPDTSPTVQGAFIDDEKLLTLRLSHGMELGRLVPSSFQIRSSRGLLFRTASIRALDAHQGTARLIQVATEEPVDFQHKLAVLVEGYRTGEAAMRNLLLDGRRFYSEVQLGAVYTPERTTFRLFSPTAAGANVILFDNPVGDEGRTVVAMKSIGRGVWEAMVEGDLNGRHYRLCVDAEGEETRREVVDIYSRCNTGHDGHGRIVNLRALDPPGFRPINRPAATPFPTDAVIYEVSVRDFTRNPNAGVPRGLNGKFLGAALRETTLPGTPIKTGIDHLVELGVTHVQLLPIHDFDNREDRDDYNWGYMTSNFSSPDGWFASDHRDDSRVKEFKALVKAFHDAGIRVVMDVVYNHTAPDATFEALCPHYYLRRREDGSLYNGSGTGNEFRSEAPMARKFIVDSCRYWADEYGVDGFRFDLMGLIDLHTLTEVRDSLHAIDPTLLVYGEPWAAVGPEDAGISQITYKNIIAGTRIGAFNDHFRNDLKGKPDGNEPGYVQTGHFRDGVKKGIMGSVHDWATNPCEAIQYATCHDNLTLFDKLKMTLPEETEDEIAKLQMLTAAILAVSQGVFFLHAGHEMCRTKHGNHNSYCSADEINWIDWGRKARFEHVFAYIRGMIAIRRRHPLFRLRTREEIDGRLHFHDDWCPTPACIAFYLNGEGLAGEPWREALVFINPERRDVVFNLPAGSWQVHVQGHHASTKALLSVQDSLPVNSRSIAVAAR